MRSWTLVIALAVAVAACSQSNTPQSGTPADKGSAPAAAGTPQAAASGTPQPAQPASTPERAAASAPALREVTIPGDTPISVTLQTAVASDTSKVEDPVRGTLAKAIVIGGNTVVPAGSEITGTVLEANRSGRVKGRASIAFRFDRLSVRNESHNITTSRIAREAPSTQGKDAKKIGIGAGAGAVIGAIAGGGKGAAVGAGVGGAAGTGAVLATRGKEVSLPAGTVVTTKLREPLKVLVPAEQQR